MRFALYAASAALLGLLGLVFWLSSGKPPEKDPGDRVADLPALDSLDQILLESANAAQAIVREPAYRDSVLPVEASRLVETLRLTGNRLLTLRPAADEDPARLEERRAGIRQVAADLGLASSRLAAFASAASPADSSLKDGFGRLLRLGEVLRYFVEAGVPCAKEQRELREIAGPFEESRRWWLEQMAAVLAGREPQATLVTFTEGALAVGRKALVPLYDRLNPIYIEAQSCANAVAGLEKRLDWCRLVRDRIAGSDPWLQDPAHDLAAEGPGLEGLRGRQRDYLLRIFSLEPLERARLAKAILEDGDAALRRLNEAWIPKARELGLDPMPQR